MKRCKLFCLVSLIITFLIITSCTSEPKNIAISSDGVEIHFNVEGQGTPSIILVHGWSNTKELWDSQVTCLSQKYKVIALDLAGFGESGNNRSYWSMKSFSTDIIAVIEKINLENVILVGFSMGGPVIIEASKKIPERISGLVLVDILQDIEEKASQEWVDNSIKKWREIFTDRKRIPELFPAKMDTIIIERYISMTFTASKVGWWESIEDFFRWSREDCQESIKSLQVPLMSINSDYATTNVEAYLKYVPSYKLKTISTIGHFVMWEAPDEFNRLLEECVQEFINDSKYD